uniref:Uncharacterized protein n=1 Tax=viral metagenome TaxID=1070528 RepID=A0A6M3M567_9ZZZZ
MDVDPSIVVALISLLATIFVAFLGRDKLSKAEAVQLENRLTSIERALEDKLNPIWNAIMTELPKILISPHTPKLDILLKKALNGFSHLSGEEAKTLAKGLDENYSADKKNVDSAKRLVAVLIRSALRAEMGV